MIRLEKKKSLKGQFAPKSIYHILPSAIYPSRCLKDVHLFSHVIALHFTSLLVNIPKVSSLHLACATSLPTRTLQSREDSEEMRGDA